MINQVWIAIKVGSVIFLAGILFAWLAKPAEARWVRTRGMPLMVGLYAAGMILPSVWLIYILILALIPLLARSRPEAASLYIVIMLALPRLYTEQGLGSIYLLAFDKWLFGALGVAIAFMMHRAAGPRPRRWFDLPFYLVMILELVQARGLNFTSVLRAELTIALCFILPYFVVSRAMRRPQDVRMVMTALCFAAFSLSVVAVFEARTNFLVFDPITRHLHTSDIISGYSHQRSGMVRAMGSFEDATAFGGFLAIGAIVTLALRDVFRTKRYWIGAILVIMAGLYSCNARGAVIGLGIGLVCYDVYRKRYQSLAMKAAGFGMVALIALMVAQFSTSVAERLGVGGDSVGTADYRRLLWQRGMEEIWKHPLVGQNINYAMAALSDLRQGEGLVDLVNGYIAYGLTTGIPGMIALFGCFALTATNAYGLRRRVSRDRQLVQAGATVFAVGLAMMVVCFTSGFGGRGVILFYIVIGIGSALRAMRLEDEDASQPVAVEPPPARLPTPVWQPT